MANQQERGGRQPQQGGKGQPGRQQQQEKGGKQQDQRHERLNPGGERMNPDRNPQQHR
jgi:hypothetical protein